MSGLIRSANEKGQDFPIGDDYELHCRLETIKRVLEWVDASLVKTDPRGRSEIERLMGDSYYYGLDGPVNTEMIKRRV